MFCTKKAVTSTGKTWLRVPVLLIVIVSRKTLLHSAKNYHIRYKIIKVKIFNWLSVIIVNFSESHDLKVKNGMEGRNFSTVKAQILGIIHSTQEWYWTFLNSLSIITFSKKVRNIYFQLLSFFKYKFFKTTLLPSKTKMKLWRLFYRKIYAV